MRSPYGNLTSPARRPLDRDRLAMVSRTEAAHAAHAALSALQDKSPELMMAGAELLFATLCKRCRLDPHDEYLRGLKLLTPQPGFRKDNDSLQSLQDFAGIRIMGETSVSIS